MTVASVDCCNFTAQFMETNGVKPDARLSEAHITSIKCFLEVDNECHNRFVKEIETDVIPNQIGACGEAWCRICWRGTNPTS